MTTYQKILSAFQGQGYYQDSLFTENQLLRALDSLAAQNARASQYDRNVATQLWDQTPKQSDGKVILRNYIQTITKGQSIVRNQISSAQQQIGNIPNGQQKEQRLQDLLSYTEDHKFLTLPFGIAGPKQSKILQSSHLDQSRRSSVSGSTVIFAKSQKKGRGKSTDLKFVFVFALIAILIECVIMFHKHHFFNLLTYLSIFAIFFLNYFDHYYMKFVMACLFISIIFDVVWIFVHANEYWYPWPETQHSSLQYGFLKFIVLFTVFLAFLKLIIGAILFKYMKNPQNLRKQCTVCGKSYPLDGTHNSAVARVIKGDYYNDFNQPSGF